MDILEYDLNIANTIVTTAGNVGIGTTSPTSKLDIKGNLVMTNLSTPNTTITTTSNIYNFGEFDAMNLFFQNNIVDDNFERSVYGDSIVYKGATTQTFDIQFVFTGIDTFDIPNTQLVINISNMGNIISTPFTTTITSSTVTTGFFSVTLQPNNFFNITGGFIASNVTLQYVSSISIPYASLSSTGNLNLLGNVGIGTISPLTKLEISSGSLASTTFNNPGNVYLNAPNSILRLGSANYSGNGNTIANLTTGTNTILFTSYRDVNMYRVGSKIQSINVADDLGLLLQSSHLTFSTCPRNNYNNGVDDVTIEHMRITNTGNIGIGTTSPSERLHVAGNTRLAGALQVASGSTSSNYIINLGASGAGTTRSGYIYGDGEFMNINNQQNGPMVFYTNNTERMRIAANGSVSVTGALSKGSGSFDIPHPLDNTKRLVHSFIEGPRCDLIYRGSVQLVNGFASINLDSDCVENTESQMSPGTFEALCANPQYFLQNHSSFARVKGSISGNTLTIECEDSNSSDVIYWSVIAERKDQTIKDWNRTTEDGYLITEYQNEQPQATLPN